MHGGRAVRGLASLRGGIRAATERRVLVEERQVIMGRAFKVGCPLCGNEFSNRPIGHPPAGNGLVIMGRAAGPGCPVRPGANEDVAGGCWVIMGRALKAGYPLRGNGFSN